MQHLSKIKKHKDSLVYLMYHQKVRRISMSQIHYTITTQFKHLTETEHQLIENWLNEGESQTKIRLQYFRTI